MPRCPIGLITLLGLLACTDAPAAGTPPGSTPPASLGDGGRLIDAAGRDASSVVEPGTPCRLVDDPRAGGPTHRAVIGYREDPSEPIDIWADGSAVDYEWGYQGGAMITPSLRVESVSAPAEGICVRALVRNEFLAPRETDEPGIVRDLVFYPSGEDLETANLWNLIAYDPPDDRELDLMVDLRSTDWVAQTQIRVRIGSSRNVRTPHP